MKAQLVTDHVRVQVDTHGPDMSELLRDIRSQYEAAAKKNREEAEAWYNSKVSFVIILENPSGLNLQIYQYNPSHLL